MRRQDAQIRAWIARVPRRDSRPLQAAPRRAYLEAYVGMDSFRHLAKERALMAGLASSLKVPSEEVPGRVATLVERLRAAEKELDRLRMANARAAAGNAAAGAEQIGEVRVVAQRMAGGMSGGTVSGVPFRFVGFLSLGFGFGFRFRVSVFASSLS